jgi:tRNA-specific adenosine deaminase 2
MFRTGTLQRQAPWAPFVVASAALGLALYYLRTPTSPPRSSASNLSQVNEQQPCQAPDDLLAAMDAEERAYHERFMREAIAMVNPLLHTKPNGTWLTHHHDRLSLP